MNIRIQPRIPFNSIAFFTLLLLANGFTHKSCTFSRLSKLQESSKAAEAALERTASQLERLKSQANKGTLGTIQSHDDVDPEVQRLITEYLQLAANTLKQELKSKKLPTKGRKPDLARRLAQYEIQQTTGRIDAAASSQQTVKEWIPVESTQDEKASFRPLVSFCGLKLSDVAGMALAKASFKSPSPIQLAAIPRIANGESVIIHAQTGSGKTLAYLLPITERLWREYETETDEGYAMILTPTRELAAQVAGIAAVLAPPGTVRMVSHPSNLMSDGIKDRGELESGGRLDNGDGRTYPRLFIGSAKSIMHSLYGDGKMPASPTTKPEAKYLMQNTRWVVMDEVDRLLDVNRGRGSSSSSKRHEKPAAVVTSAIARLTFGKAQVVSASATVGRSLKRELSRVLGLSPKEFPTVVRGHDSVQEEDFRNSNKSGHLGRAVTIPDSVSNYVVAVDTSSVGKLLTSAFYVIKELHESQTKKILVVLTRGSGINTQNTIGALKHFGCQPDPRSLLDVLEAEGTDRMIEVHRQVSGATGVGESLTSGKDESYLLVTGEDTVRGLHLDGLDAVVVVGRAQGPDEYTHIAGRTGRAGRQGKVINVLGDTHAAAVKAWEIMLNTKFEEVAIQDISSLP